jgi:hypothetical protein
MQLLKPINLDEFETISSVNTLFLIDIMRMRELNEVYGYVNGNEILKQFSSLFNDHIVPNIQKLLKNYKSKKVYIEFYNAYVDIFALKIYDEMDDRILLKIKDMVLNKILSHQFSLDEYGIKINIDITMGCSQ